MSRIRSVAASALEVNRRTVLAAAGAVSLSAGVGYALRPTDSQAATTAAAPVAQSRQAPAAAPLVPYTKGTTLASVAAPLGSSGYRRLGDGPGWGRVVRSELAAPKSGRAGRRTALAAFVQFTDLHLQDVQHPLRLEYLRSHDVHAWRPHEALTVPGAVSLVERVNALRGAPVTGAPLHFVMTTGDNTDNNAHSELEWFMKVMSGGRITPNSGDARHYEGVQNSGLKLYWQPDSALRDGDKALGFPQLKGFLAAAIREVQSPGLKLPWFSTVGNHDALPLGCYGSHGDPYLAEAAIGGKKLFSVSAADAQKLQDAIKNAKDPKGTGYRDFLKAHARSMRSVTPDEKRAPYTQADYLKAHLDPAYQGHGPAGHGYSSANLDAGLQDGALDARIRHVGSRGTHHVVEQAAVGAAEQVPEADGGLVGGERGSAAGERAGAEDRGCGGEGRGEGAAPGQAGRPDGCGYAGHMAPFPMDVHRCKSRAGCAAYAQAEPRERATAYRLRRPPGAAARPSAGRCRPSRSGRSGRRRCAPGRRR
jgi:hypothetical protein